jgi:predicted chitinase
MIDQLHILDLLTLAWPMSTKKARFTLAEGMAETMIRYEINNKARIKHFIGQVGHECGQGRYMEEIASGAAYEGRKDLGNVAKGDGKKFKGRGLIQLTGRANYAMYQTSALPERLNVNLLENPELVATNPLLCCDAAGWYWRLRGLNAIADGPHNEAETCKLITKKVNGGYNGLHDRLALVELARLALSKLNV